MYKYSWCRTYLIQTLKVPTWVRDVMKNYLNILNGILKGLSGSIGKTFTYISILFKFIKLFPVLRVTSRLVYIVLSPLYYVTPCHVSIVICISLWNFIVKLLTVLSMHPDLFWKSGITAFTSALFVTILYFCYLNAIRWVQRYFSCTVFSIFLSYSKLGLQFYLCMQGYCLAVANHFFLCTLYGYWKYSNTRDYTYFNTHCKALAT